MNTNINLKEIERKAWRSFYEDGFWEIFIGMILVAFAVNASLSAMLFPEWVTMTIFTGIEVLGIIILMAGKKWITVPRLGRVKFNPDRKRKNIKVRTVLLISALVGLVMFLLVTEIISKNGKIALDLTMMPFIFAANILIVFSLTAYFMDFERLYIIGGLFALTVPLDLYLSPLLGFDTAPIIFGTAAAIILAMGLVVLSRFLRTYPKIKIVDEIQIE